MLFGDKTHNMNTSETVMFGDHTYIANHPEIVLFGDKIHNMNTSETVLFGGESKAPAY